VGIVNASPILRTIGAGLCAAAALSALVLFADLFWLILRAQFVDVAGRLHLRGAIFIGATVVAIASVVPSAVHAFSLLQEQSRPHARLEFAGLAAEPAQNRLNLLPVLRFANDGQLAATHVQAFGLSYADMFLMTVEEQKRYMRRVVAAARKPDVEPDDPRELTVGGETTLRLTQTPLEKADYQSISDGQKSFYVFAVARFSDAAPGPDKYWLSEFCGVFSAGLAKWEPCAVGSNTVELVK
ncbi:MAG TPA: hypothetical protein VKS60_06750, partial [Stellaceae bacterium]|nr:hypothetical protein [Stellaceae bacterium]